MADITIAGIMRSGAYSPNHIGNDAAIFNAVTEQLRKRGCRVSVYSEERLAAGDVTEQVVIDMCREWRSIQALQQMEDAGVTVINSGYGIENCTHGRMTRILRGSGIAFPESLITDTNAAVAADLSRAGYQRCWVKRGDYHSVHKEDCSLVRTAQEAQEVLKEYFLRGIGTAVVTKHLRGRHLKFYGVQGTPFFYHYPEEDDEECTPIADAQLAGRMHELAGQAAEALGVVVYGGDCILAPDGTLTIVDFNDWPSFAPCRQEASVAIAKRVLAAAKARQH